MIKFKRSKMSQAILTAMTAASISMPASAQIEEVIVTATKRSANAQDIPVAVNVFGEDELKNRKISNFDDLVKNLPNVTLGVVGPGKGEVYIRGMAVDNAGTAVGGAQAAVPNVAIYLDEQPTTSPSRILDVYTTDMERVEVLPGPQGTLFGASSMAGTIRLITNKPVLNEFQGGFTIGIADTRHGSISNSVEGYINIPVIDDKLAVRVVAYNAKRGGYIDNENASVSLAEFVPNNPALAALGPATTFETVTNSELAEDDFNDATYSGFRASARFIINDNWELRVQDMYQELDADGVFDYDPSVGDLKVERFFKDDLVDTFNQVAWTLDGRVGALEVLYTGAYLDRDIDQSSEANGYNNTGRFIAYYTCNYTFLTGLVYRECLNPVKGFVIDQRINRQTHEFRFHTSEENRWHLTAGVFYDDFELETLDTFHYASVVELGFAPNAPISTAQHFIAQNGVPQPAGIAFYNDIGRTEEQIAVYGELSFDIIPDTLTVTGGLRYYDFEIDFAGTSNFANGPFSGSVDGDAGFDYDASFGHSTDPFKQDDVLFKANISWQVNDDKLLYATWSEGYRPGGFNRSGGAPPFNPAFATLPLNYQTDTVENYEIGWKTRWLDGTLQFNGAAFFIDWSNAQVFRFDPVNVSNLFFIDNAADAEIVGVEGDMLWVPTDQLTINAAFAYLDTKLDRAFSNVITLAPVGSDLPLSPPFQMDLRARYNWEVGTYRFDVQGALQYADSSFSSLVANDRRRQDSYTTADLSLGVAKDAWRAEIFAENITDKRAELYINVQQFEPRITTNRPRTVGFRLSYDYN